MIDSTSIIALSLCPLAIHHPLQKELKSKTYGYSHRADLLTNLMEYEREPKNQCSGQTDAPPIGCGCSRKVQNSALLERFVEPEKGCYGFLGLSSLVQRNPGPSPSHGLGFRV